MFSKTDTHAKAALWLTTRGLRVRVMDELETPSGQWSILLRHVNGSMWLGSGPSMVDALNNAIGVYSVSPEARN